MKLYTSFFFFLLTFIPVLAQVTPIPVTGTSPAMPSIQTINPLALNGHSYCVTYNYISDQNITWNLTDLTLHKQVLNNQPTNALPVSVDGFSISVNILMSSGVKSCSVIHGSKRFSAVNANLGFEGFGGAIGYSSPRLSFGDGKMIVPDSALKNVTLYLAKVTDTSSYNPVFDLSDTNMSYAYRYGRRFTVAPVDARFTPYMINTTGTGYPFQDFKKSVPLSAWDESDPLHPRRLEVAFLENNATSGLVDGKWWPGSYTQYDNISSSGPREWLWIFNSTYSTTPNPDYETDVTANSQPIMYFLTVNRNGSVPFSPNSSGEDQFAILTSYEEVSHDTVSFIASCSGYNVPGDFTKKLNLNNISAWESNNGYCDNSPSQNEGVFYPRGTADNVVYMSGFIWGGYVPNDPLPRVGGSTYRSGLQPGKILSQNVVESPSLAKNRLYRIRPNFATADLSVEVSDEWISADAIRTAYSKDWADWPAMDGAPYIDANSNGKYDPATDIAGINGAAQTMWYVANDLNPALTTYLYGSQPIGIEMQATFWTYSIPGALNNTILKKYKLINKSGAKVDSMYVSAWSDPDVGNGNDDFCGTDIDRSMIYCYNSAAYDNVCGNNPPAVGFAFLQTPTVAFPGNLAYSGEKWHADKMNIPIAASYYFTRGDPSVADPLLGDAAGATQFYNFMRGRSNSNYIYTDPKGNATTFPVAGDPITNTGWVDGVSYPAGDRRSFISAGPFSMAAGDTQEVVIAEIIADARPNTGNLAAVVKLRQYCDSVRAVYYSLPNLSTGINDKGNNTTKKFALYQNYPNPFNPTTIIRYDLPATEKVSLKIYDMLGREVASLVNQEQSAGSHEASFDASHMASGIYIYKLVSNSFTAEKKMLLLK